MTCLLVFFVIASIGVNAQSALEEESALLLGRGRSTVPHLHFAPEQPALGFQQGELHPYLRRVFLMGLYDDTVDQYTTKINDQKARTDEAEKARTELMEKFVRQVLIIADLLEDGPSPPKSFSPYVQSSPYGYPSVLGGNNPFIKQLLARKFLEETTTKYRLIIEEDQKNSGDPADAVSKTLKKYANQVIVLRRILGI
jgi:hypothetical protein